MTTLHVAVTGSDDADGTAENPLRTISRAAALAVAGDTVEVHEGEYREWVKPARGGLSEQRRIVYQAAAGEHVVIKGSERITTWEQEEGDVWRAEVPNRLFGAFNPFAELLAGDWLISPEPRHLGEVYLNGTSLFEVEDRSAVTAPAERADAVDGWTGNPEPFEDPARTRYVWYAEVDAEKTTIWANFQGADPNTELVEINVRRSVFYPEQHHINYITVRGFELAQAATPWTPPTADQPGLIGPNWAKGWVIEDNVIHDAKTSAISLGKEITTGHNYATDRGDKPGYQYQLESVFAARQIGWDAEHIGSHIVRRNTIFDCGQNGIVGHLGAVFSVIEDNHIHHIGTKREYFGHEIGGIKLHAAIDVQILHNRIHRCTLGIWLDWQTQGTRVARNLLYANTRDLFVEVSHGPYTVDHNILASPVAIENFSQGGAYLHNLVAGAVRLESVMDRATPYHRPHSTQVAGFGVITGGDDRLIGNLFLAGDPDRAYRPGSRWHETATFGTCAYQDHPRTFQEYIQRAEAQGGGDHRRFHGLKQPAYIHHNGYAAGARGCTWEHEVLSLRDPVAARIVDDGEQVHLEVEVTEELAAGHLALLTAADLPRVRLADADFEEPDGSSLVVSEDLVGQRKTAGRLYPVGPFADLPAGRQRIRIW